MTIHDDMRCRPRAALADIRRLRAGLRRQAATLQTRIDVLRREQRDLLDALQALRATRATGDADRRQVEAALTAMAGQRRHEIMELDHRRRQLLEADDMLATQEQALRIQSEQEPVS